MRLLKVDCVTYISYAYFENVEKDDEERKDTRVVMKTTNSMIILHTHNTYNTYLAQTFFHAIISSSDDTFSLLNKATYCKC